MREILFRGQRIDNGEWVEGFLFKTQAVFHEHTYIAYDKQFDDDLFLSPKNIFIEVIPETIGQYTGLTDKNGKRIFEGDILQRDGGFRFAAAWCPEEARFVIYGYIDGVKYENAFVKTRFEEFEIIGNTHDNPELLKGENK